MDTNKVNGMRQNEVEKFSAPDLDTPSIPLKNPEGVKGEDEAGGKDKQPGAWGGCEGAGGEDMK